MKEATLRKKLIFAFLIIGITLTSFVIIVTLYEERNFERTTTRYYLKKESRVVRLILDAHVEKLGKLAKELTYTPEFDLLLQATENPLLCKNVSLRLKQLGIKYLLLFCNNSYLSGFTSKGGLLTSNPLGFVPRKPIGGVVTINGKLYIVAVRSGKSHGCYIALVERLLPSYFGGVGKLVNLKISGKNGKVCSGKESCAEINPVIFLKDIYGKEVAAIVPKPRACSVMRAHDEMVMHVFLFTVFGVVLSAFMSYLITRTSLIDNVEQLIKSIRNIHSDMSFNPPKFDDGEFKELAETIRWLIEKVKEGEFLFKIAANLIPVGVVVYREKLLFANREAVKLFGDEILKECSITDLVEEKYRTKMELIKKARLDGKEFSVSYTIRLKNKPGVVVRVISTTIHYQGAPAGLAAFVDITLSERIREFYRAIMGINDVLVKCNDEGRILKSVCDILSKVPHLNGVCIADYEGRSIYKKPEEFQCAGLSSQRVSIERYENGARLHLPIEVSGKVEYVLRLNTNIGDLFKHEIVMILSQLKVNIGATIERIRAHRAQLQLLFYDQLTGLKNFNALKKDIATLDACTLFYLNLKNISFINQAYGYEFTDRLIVSVATSLENTLKDRGELYRLHGDRFAFLIKKEISKECVQQVAGEIKQRLKDYPFESRTIPLAVDIGVTMMPALVETIAELISSAEAALLKAKQTGELCFYSESMKREIDNNIKIESMLKKAIKDKLFEFHYQPVVSLRTGKVEKAEALIRLRDENGRYINPERFITLAERFNMIRDITRIVIEKTFSETRNLGIGVSINFSAMDIESEEIIEHLERFIASSNNRIAVEITERDVMHNIESAKRFIERIKALGVEVEIDDFGIGYSSFDRIVELDFDLLKIDKSLIDLIGKNVKAERIVAYIIRLAHSLGAKALAEGIETRPR